MDDAHYRIIGVMSGTSLDGIDLACVHFNYRENQWDFEIENAETLPYPGYWQNCLQGIYQKSSDEINRIDTSYTEFLAQTVKGFMTRQQINQIDAVASHGHTVFHQPESGVTFQMGNLPGLAGLIGQKVVCDFRVQDVKLGGQGAPLVPIGDQLLFSDFEACLNLGGFANISLEQHSKRIAFDIGAVNTVMNALAKERGKPYDDQGSTAASGKINSTLKKELDDLTFYAEKPPKSLGIEWVKEHVFPLLKESKAPINDQLRTYCEHITDKIAEQLPRERHERTLVTGGGALNRFFMARLCEKTPSEIVVPDRKLIDFKEALIFAFLGVLRLRGETNVLKSVTGAQKDHCAGLVYGV